MSYASKKGYWAESAVEDYLKEHGWDCIRKDIGQGDIWGVPFVASVKNCKEMRLAQWTDEMVSMVKRSPWDTGFVVHKRPRKGEAGDWYSTMPFSMLIPLLPNARTQ